jgi:catechol 2,3-dioxygenase-like lactoylglutathione lyase family enzyme
MVLERMDHVGIVVEDLDAAVEFFADLGLQPQGRMALANDPSLDRIVGLDGASTEVAMMKMPDGHGGLELIKFLSPESETDTRPPAANAPGLRHITFAVDDIRAALDGLKAHGGELVGELENYGDSYWLCYVRGPAGIIVELAEKIGSA